MERFGISVVAALVVFTAPAANAATIYTDRASFLAALAYSGADGFEIAPLNGVDGTFENFGASYTNGGYVVTGNGSVFVIDPITRPIFQWNSGNVLNAGSSILISVLPNVFSIFNAVGFDYGKPTTSNPAVRINGVDYTSFDQPHLSFFGIVQEPGQQFPSSPFQISVDFRDSLFGVIDNVTFGGAIAAPVPNPIVGAGLPGLVMALGGLLAWRRRRMVAA
jgi:hypothetical protein